MGVLLVMMRCKLTRREGMYEPYRSPRIRYLWSVRNTAAIAPPFSPLARWTVLATSCSGLEGQSTSIACLPLAISDGKYNPNSAECKIEHRRGSHRPMRCDISMRMVRVKEWHTRLNVVEEQDVGAKHSAVWWRGRSDCEIDGMSWLNHSS